VRRRVATLIGLTAALGLTACGRERLDVPEGVRPLDPKGTVPADFPQAGVKFQAPGGWKLQAGKVPLLATSTSGTATVAVWRYQRSAPLPREDDALDRAEDRLVEAVKTRDPTFEADETTRVKVDGAPGIQVTGTATIEGERRRVRSTHVYAKGHELVIDAYATPEDFDRVDRSAFGPLLRSLKIDPPAA
jgi:hypothetical protein